MPRLGGRLIGLAVAGALAAPLAACGPADREPGKQASSSFADGAVAPTTTTAVTTTTTAPDRDALMAAVLQEAGREFVRQGLDVRVLGGRFDERADLVMLVIEVSSPTRALLTPIIDSSAPSHSLTDGTVVIHTEALAAGAGASKDLLGLVDGFAVEFIDSDGASAGLLAYASFDLQMYVDGKISLDELLSFAMVSGGAGQPATTTNVADTFI